MWWQLTVFGAIAMVTGIVVIGAVCALPLETASDADRNLVIALGAGIGAVCLLYALAVKYLI